MYMIVYVFLYILYMYIYIIFVYKIHTYDMMEPPTNQTSWVCRNGKRQMFENKNQIWCLVVLQ